VLFPVPRQLSSPPRVVITGAGVITALGQGWQSNSVGFRAGRTAFRPITVFDASRQRVKLAAEVNLPEGLPPEATRRLSKREAQRLERAGRLLLWAADEAWSQSGWDAGGDLPIVLGTTSGGMSLGEDMYRRTLDLPHSHTGQATRVLHYQPQRQARVLAQALGCHGPVTIIANACASGANAVGHGWELLRGGHAERVLAGGYEAITQLVFAGFDSLQALSPTRCRPFDAHRDGLSLGEGAAMLALETLEHARRRGARILGEIAGYGAATDAHHLTQPHPNGDAALAAMSAACSIAGVRPDQIGYLNAHGTGTPLNDSAEALAINRWAGAHAPNLPVSSTKAGIGHLLGAAGAVEVVICLMALREQWLPPMLTLEEPEPACAFDLVRRPRETNCEYALSNSFGFGGANASVILRRWS
jgi:3-oxoacyl-[acyl-carrier-protein] synthase II